MYEKFYCMAAGCTSLMFLVEISFCRSLMSYITPVIRQLHWLPVRQRINFKLAVLVFKALHGLAPCYLVDDCQLVTDAGRRRLRSSELNARSPKRVLVR